LVLPPFSKPIGIAQPAKDSLAHEKPPVEPQFVRGLDTPRPEQNTVNPD
jgi:hypothetical protein